MSNYVRRFSKAPQPVTAQSHRRALVTARGRGVNIACDGEPKPG